MMKLVYIASPYAGNIEQNTRMAIEYYHYAASGGVAPIAPHLLFPLFLQDSNSEERKKGIEMGLRFLASAMSCGSSVTGYLREWDERLRMPKGSASK